MKVEHYASGHIGISDEDTTLVPWAVLLRIFDQVGIVQLGSQNPAELKKIGSEAKYTMGDYEITIKRTQKKQLADNGIINLQKARRFVK